ncbi:hypothetical protein BKA58DRAFT_437295 [Alternaria rosae]|uniref:uncharacterized protein n=1 Tax=Alternaria rosae TaxID=1187941 RepID=UPI001E8CE321|nr:uncharacterized protein BKA58DRAFT_437295 [Alternaria rosae]KAH6875313.1 hypothetical protein BKA58DRAFT_437295 [Alternaria rosae]
MSPVSALITTSIEVDTKLREMTALCARQRRISLVRCLAQRDPQDDPHEHRHLLLGLATGHAQAVALEVFYENNYFDFASKTSFRAPLEAAESLWLETGNPARTTAVNHSDVLAKPMDARADVHAFLSERSKVLDLRMSGLPHDTTQSELEGWFTRFGGRRIAFWTRKQQVAFP